MTPDCRTSPHKRVVPPDVKMSNNILFLTTALTHNYLADKHKIALICEKRARSTLSWRIFKFGSVNSIQNLSLYCCIEVIGARLGKHLPKLSPGSHTHLDAVSCKRRLREQLRCVMSSKGTGADFLCSSRTPRFPPPPSHVAFKSTEINVTSDVQVLKFPVSSAGASANGEDAGQSDVDVTRGLIRTRSGGSESVGSRRDRF